MKTILRILLLVNFFLLIQPDLFSQKNQKATAKAIEEADQYFDNEEFYLAAKKYGDALQIQPDSKYALYRLAESNRMFFNYKSAEDNYKKLLDKGGDSEYPLAQLWYGQMLKLNGKYEEAEQNLQKFIDGSYSGANADNYKALANNEIQGCKLAMVEMKKPQKEYTFEILPAPVNTSFSDYSPVVYENDSSIVIASSRTESKGKDEYSYLGGEFSDNFRFTKGNGGWSPLGDNDMFHELHTEFNESPGSYTHDKKKFYFTRCDNLVNKDGLEVRECMIYLSVNKEGKWQKAVRLNDNINTKDEWNAQPSISPNGDTMFFVSKRSGGQGMHDIWMSTSSGNDDWGPAVNLGPEINTTFIDMSPCYYSKEKTLFYASNGKEGFGGLDIFIAKGEAFKDIKNAGLPFNSNRDDFYFILGENKGYLASNREGGLGNDDIYRFNIKAKESVIAEITEDSIKDAKSITITGKLKDVKTGKGASDQVVLLEDKKGDVVKKTQTDETGLFRMENLKPDKYKVKQQDYDPNLTADVKYVVDNVKVKKSQDAVTRKSFENIYFDFDQYALRPEAIKALDELVAYCKANPSIQIEMRANTDAYGSDGYNVSLSQHRGKTAMDYLMAKGLKKSALVINAKGEGQPIATNHNPAGRQLNRRVEFYIVGGNNYEAKAMVYVVEPNMTLYSVAKKFNMSVAELKEWNGLTDESIFAYRPLRVRRSANEDIIAKTTLAFVKSAPDTDFPDQEDNGGIQQENHHEKNLKVNEAPKKEETFVSKEVVNSEKEHDEAKHEKVIKSPAMVPGSNNAEERYIVEEGDVVFSIAIKFGMSVEDLRSLNKLKSDKLYVGQKLKVIKDPRLQADPSALYTVRNGDSVASISEKFGISVEELESLNHLKSHSLYEGMVLRIKK